MTISATVSTSLCYHVGSKSLSLWNADIRSAISTDSALEAKGYVTATGLLDSMELKLLQIDDYEMLGVPRLVSTYIPQDGARVFQLTATNGTK